MGLEQVSLVLFFSHGVSLQTWRETGLFDREVELYKRLSKYLGEISFITYGDSQDKEMERDLGAPIRICPNHSRFWARLSKYMPQVLLPQNWYTLRCADILKTNQLSAAVPAILAKRILNKKLITRCGYLWSYTAEKENRPSSYIERIRRIERQAFHSADLGVVTTADIRSMVIDRYDVPPDKLRIIPNYVNTDIFAKKPEVPKEKGLVICVGRLENEKNLPALMVGLDLAEKKRQRQGRGNNPYHLEIIGEGSLKRKLRELANQLEIEVRFLDRVPNYQLPAVLNRAEVFALVSLFEGHPKTPIEAMGCQLAVLGTNVSGIRDEIKHGKTGYLCETSAESIAGALFELMEDVSFRQRLGEAGRRYVLDNYSMERVVQQELDALGEVMGSPRVMSGPTHC